jgi:hypothetical protein
MEGPAHWLTGIVVFGGGFAVLLMMLALRGRRHRRNAQRQIFCPRHREWVDCTLSMSTLTGACIDVERCGEFDPPERVSCTRPCVNEVNAVPPVRSSA